MKEAPAPPLLEEEGNDDWCADVRNNPPLEPGR